MCQKLQAVINGSGIWSGPRAESHAFLLSPSVYEISKNQARELSLLGFALYDCLLGLSRMAVVAYDQTMNYGGVWRFVRQVFSTGVPLIYHQLQGMNSGHIPQLLKVDLMVDCAGNFRIAEIDGHNKHGLGYSTLGLRFREALEPQLAAFPGAVKLLAAEIKRLGHRGIKLLYGDQERFYVPEFEVAKQEFAKHGIDCAVVSELDANPTFVESGLFLDLPFLYHKKELYDAMVPAYKTGRVSFIIPPKPFLGAKGVLALLRNDGANDCLEALMRAFIRKPSLDLVRTYIPQTFLVGKKAEGAVSLKNRLTEQRWVLKESISSGMKGTTFSDEPEFGSVLNRACATNMNWILQEEVINQPQTFSWLKKGTGDDGEFQTADDWFMRVTVQYIQRQVGDVIVTARRDKAVHGGKDCIQLGTVIV